MHLSWLSRHFSVVLFLLTSSENVRENGKYQWTLDSTTLTGIDDKKTKYRMKLLAFQLIESNLYQRAVVYRWTTYWFRKHEVTWYLTKFSAIRCVDKSNKKSIEANMKPSKLFTMLKHLHTNAFLAISRQ